MVVCSVSAYKARHIPEVPKQHEYETLMLRNVKVSKRNEYISYTRVNLRFSQVFGIFDNLPGKANVRYFLSERSLSKRGLKLLQRCNKKTQRCIHRILGNTEVLRGSDVEKC